ncbi:MAG: flagellar biosynthetic protein FliO [Motiliproteus sp.]|nr:flagellar biosynthetic protein FliO [Motiliproteus sp.]MCW9052019.1 flagellar biosynthetic protein FliO [Motiliproteus sp.]
MASVASRAIVLAFVFIYSLAAVAETAANVPSEAGSSQVSNAVTSTVLSPTSVTNPAVEPFSAGSAMQLILGLGLVIVLIFALAWFARRVGGVSGFNHPQLKVVATLAMSTRERVVLVQAGKQQMLLGVAPGRVNLLHSFDEPIIDPQVTPVSQFADRLKDAMSRSKDQ